MLSLLQNGVSGTVQCRIEPLIVVVTFNCSLIVNVGSLQVLTFFWHKAQVLTVARIVGCWHVTILVSFCQLLVFRRKDLCEAKHETQSVFKFGRPGGRSTGRSTAPSMQSIMGKNFFRGRWSGRSNPPVKYQMPISYRFLLSELIPGRSRGRSTPLQNTKCQISYRFLLWELIPVRSTPP